MGCGVRSSQTTNPARATTATASAGTDRPCGSSMIVQTSADMPATDSTAPSGSGLVCGPLDSGMSTSEATMASAAIGTLIRKTAPHQNQAISAPPSTGPPTSPTMATALQAAIALRLSCSSNTVIRIDRVLGMMSAPPMPITVRAAISVTGSAA